jgi:hypothetical protein
MNDSSTSLDRLHDLVLPPAVPWWPLTTGWYVVMGIILVFLLVFAYRTWKSWKANAYRRAALSQLAETKDALAIAELLRCTALAVAPRHVIAEKTDMAWTNWLMAQCPEAMPDAVRTQLTAGIYAQLAEDADIRALREYAACWIKGHHRPMAPAHPSPC